MYFLKFYYELHFFSFPIEVEFKCPCTSHEGKEMLNAIFPLSVDQVFYLIFNGSKFYYDLLESRKTYGNLYMYIHINVILSKPLLSFIMSIICYLFFRTLFNICVYYYIKLLF